MVTDSLKCEQGICLFAFIPSEKRGLYQRPDSDSICLGISWQLSSGSRVSLFEAQASGWKCARCIGAQVSYRALAA
jgi:hypothetical protein